MWYEKYKKCKINSRNFTYDGITFSSSFYLFKEVKDDNTHKNKLTILHLFSFKMPIFVCINYKHFLSHLKHSSKMSVLGFK